MTVWSCHLRLSVYVTLLKLHLHLQVALQQIKNYRLHITTDSTAVPEETMCQSMKRQCHLCVETTAQTSAPAAQYSVCS